MLGSLCSNIFVDFLNSTPLRSEAWSGAISLWTISINFNTIKTQKVPQLTFHLETHIDKHHRQ